MDYSQFLSALQALELKAEIRQIRLVDGSLLEGRHSLLHSPDESALYYFSKLEKSCELLEALLEKIYPNDELTFLKKKDSSWKIDHFAGAATREFLKGESEGFIYFPAVCMNSSLIAFRELVAHLRAPEGCPWDREQTHQSLKPNLLEETYEVLDAIDGGAPADLCEELGDLLLQIILHSQISAETGQFSIDDVIQGIHAKITFRHPHVFKDVNVEGSKDVIRNWEVLKAQERENNHKKKDSILDSIPRAMPALSLAQKYQERAARVGFDWPEITPVLDKVIEEVGELKAAETKAEQEAEIGDLFFALVNVARWYGFSAEDALRKMTLRFYNRFRQIEIKASSAGRKLTDLSLEEMDALWEQAKQNEVTEARNGL
ncbi:MAG: nucleoside triphosphate pyrophosphohydrolase [Anaerolineae bacterium]|nr:nucleoside triphosphate pyrophosphohydrolase [Anaerolineae bacterium]